MIRNTPASNVIKCTLIRMGHPTAKQLYDEIHPVFPKIALSTVFRQLGEAADRGEILRLKIPGADDIFDATIAAHSHIRCRVCGRIDDLVQSDLTQTEEAAKKLGYTVEHTELSLCGICRTCKDKEKKL